MRRAFFFIVVFLFATTAAASLPRASALDDATSVFAPLPETRIRVSEDLAPFERPAESELTRALRQGYEQASTTNASGLAGFLSVDPGKDWDPKQPQSWNMYSYVRNNPINRTDPTGRFMGLAVPDVEFVYGVVSAFGSNLVLGHGRPEATSQAMENGQIVGDMLSVAAGAAEVVIGTNAAATGALATVGTGGTASPASVPLAAGGALAAAHGTTVVATATGNLIQAGAQMSRTTPQIGRGRPRPNEQYNNPPSENPRPASPSDPKQPKQPEVVKNEGRHSLLDKLADILDSIF